MGFDTSKLHGNVKALTYDVLYELSGCHTGPEIAAMIEAGQAKELVTAKSLRERLCRGLSYIAKRDGLNRDDLKASLEATRKANDVWDRGQHDNEKKRRTPNAEEDEEEVDVEVEEEVLSVDEQLDGAVQYTIMKNSQETAGEGQACKVKNKFPSPNGSDESSSKHVDSVVDTTPTTDVSEDVDMPNASTSDSVSVPSATFPSSAEGPIDVSPTEDDDPFDWENELHAAEVRAVFSSAASVDDDHVFQHATKHTKAETSELLNTDASQANFSNRLILDRIDLAVTRIAERRGVSFADMHRILMAVKKGNGVIKRESAAAKKKKRKRDPVRYESGHVVFPGLLRS